MRFRLRDGDPRPPRKFVLIARVIVTLLGVVLIALGFILGATWLSNGSTSLIPVSAIVGLVGIVLFWFGLTPSNATVGNAVVDFVSLLLLDIFAP